MDRLSMRSPINFLLLIVLLVVGCDQTPTSLEEEPYQAPVVSETLEIAVLDFDFDPLSGLFFFSAAASSPDTGLVVNFLLASYPISITGTLLDNGFEGDIIARDGIYSANWQLPDSLDAYIDSSWTLQITATDEADAQSESRSLSPQRPNPPLIESVEHADTLSLHLTSWVVDTLTAVVTHPQGLDEIRDLRLLSLKPDGTYANSGQPIPLYDDGGSQVFYSFDGVDYTSGDQIAGDGVYSLLLILTPGNLAGTYYWEFTARSWLGIDSEIFEDSLVVLPASEQQPGHGSSAKMVGVFK